MLRPDKPKPPGTGTVPVTHGTAGGGAPATPRAPSLRPRALQSPVRRPRLPRTCSPSDSPASLLTPGTPPPSPGVSRGLELGATEGTPRWETAGALPLFCRQTPTSSRREGFFWTQDSAMDPCFQNPGRLNRTAGLAQGFQFTVSSRKNRSRPLPSRRPRECVYPWEYIKCAQDRVSPHACFTGACACPV